VSIVSAGTCSITANQAGNTNYSAATPVTDSITINPATQTISFTSTAPTSPTVGDSYTPAATATSGLAVTFSIDPASTSGACSISAGVVSFTGPGQCIIDADQAGNTDYSTAPQQQQIIGVGMADQTITFATSVPSGAMAGGTYNVSATASSGLTVTLTIDAAAASVCSITSGGAGSAVVTYTGVGNCIIDANQAGNGDYNPAPQAQQLFNVGPGAAAGLLFSVQPSNTVAGVAIAPAVQVSLVDAYGNVETGDSTDSVTLALAAGSDPSFTGAAATLSNGVATFSALTLTKAASGYALGATTTAGAFTASSNPFAVLPAAVVSLAFNPDPPANTIAGVAIPGTETVTESDQYGNVLTTDNSSTISLVANGPTSLNGSPVTATVAAGVASFSGDLVLDAAGSYTLTASTSASAIPTITSQAFTVSAASGSVLKFTPAPGDIAQGKSLGNVTVTEYDSFNNPVLSDNSTNVTLTTGACNTTLGTGTLTGGVVTIATSLDFHTVASGVALSATGSTNPTPASATFNVTAGDVVFFNGFESCTP
jgi:hypothetical protein